MKVLEILEFFNEHVEKIKSGEITESNEFVTKLSIDEFSSNYVFKRKIHNQLILDDLPFDTQIYVYNENIDRSSKLSFHGLIYKSPIEDMWHIKKLLINANEDMSSDIHIIQFNFTCDINLFMNKINIERFNMFLTIQQEAWKSLNADITSHWTSMFNGTNLKVTFQNIDPNFIIAYYKESFATLVTHEFTMNPVHLQ